MDCEEAFKEAANSNNRCGRIGERKPECGCETESVSPDSPGPVVGSETVVRLIYSPLHVDPVTGDVTEAAFSDVKDKGLSVQREAHVTSANIRAIGEQKRAQDDALGKKDRQFLGTVVAEVRTIREVTYDSGTRAFCVYDSALPSLQAHADVCQTTCSPSAMKRMRKRLRDLFQRKPKMP